MCVLGAHAAHSTTHTFNYSCPLKFLTLFIAGCLSLRIRTSNTHTHSQYTPTHTHLHTHSHTIHTQYTPTHTQYTHTHTQYTPTHTHNTHTHPQVARDQAIADALAKAELITRLQGDVEQHLATIVECRERIQEDETMRRRLHNTIQELKGRRRDEQAVPTSSPGSGTRGMELASSPGLHPPHSRREKLIFSTAAK